MLYILSESFNAGLKITKVAYQKFVIPAMIELTRRSQPVKVRDWALQVYHEVRIFPKTIFFSKLAKLQT